MKFAVYQGGASCGDLGDELSRSLPLEVLLFLYLIT